MNNYDHIKLKTNPKKTIEEIRAELMATNPHYAKLVAEEAAKKKKRK